jgi:putative DNA primase/helicase
MTTPTLYTSPTAQDLTRIPAELKAYPQWVLWRGVDKVEKKTGEIKLNKVPYNPHALTKASSTDVQTWGSFAQAVTALPNALQSWEQDDPQAYRGGGLGYVFAPDDPFCGIDLDHCRHPKTGALEPWAQQILDTLASYTEITPSGTGLHIITVGTVPAGGNRHGRLELYNTGRFFTMTGWHLPQTPPTPAPRQSQLAMVHAMHILLPKAEAKATKASQAPPRSSTSFSPTSPSDQDILTIASRAKNSAKFHALWNGDSAGYPSQSEADIALLCLLAFYTRDEGQLDALFRQSGLMDAKWERQDYRTRTITHALAMVTESYHPCAYRASQAAVQEHNSPATTPPQPAPSVHQLIHHAVPTHLLQHPDPRVREHWKRVYRKTALLKERLYRAGVIA